MYNMFLFQLYFIPIVSSIDKSRDFKFNISEIWFELKDGNEFYDGRVEILTPLGPMRASENDWSPSNTHHVCRELGYSTGYTTKKFFGCDTADKTSVGLISLKCHYDFVSERSWCDSYELKKVQSIEELNSNVWVRCIRKSDIMTKKCTVKNEEMDMICQNKKGRSTPTDQMVTLARIILGKGQYDIKASCKKVKSGNKATYDCSTDEPCVRIMKLHCGEPCQYITWSSQGRIFYNESDILEHFTLPPVCVVDVRMEKKYYIFLYIVQLKLQDCQHLLIKPEGDCFGETDLTEEYRNKSKRYFRLFDCYRFSIILLNRCPTRSNSYFEIEYMSEYYDPIKPKSAIVSIDARFSLKLKCGFYYQNRDNYLMPMVLINLTKPFKRNTAWIYEDILGSRPQTLEEVDWEVAVEQFQGKTGYATGLEHYNYGVYGLSINLSPKRNPLTYVGTYTCRQNVLHGPNTEIYWSAEIIAMYEEAKCNLNQRIYSELKVIIAHCKMGYLGRFATVATFFTSGLEHTSRIILNHSDEDYASYKMLLFIRRDDLEYINYSQISISCYIDYILPVDNVPAYNEEIPCQWNIYFSPVAIEIEHKSLIPIMMVLIAIFLCLGVLNFLFMIVRLTLHFRILTSQHNKRKQERKELIGLDVSG